MEWKYGINWAVKVNFALLMMDRVVLIYNIQLTVMYKGKKDIEGHGD